MKFTHLALVLFTIIIYSTGVAQTGWYIIPGVTGEILNEITSAFGVQWVVGDNGTILKTTDTGITWEGLNTGVMVNLKGIYQPASNQFWAAGDAGTVIITSDAGTTWILRSPPTTANLNDIFARGSGTAYVIGETGTCYYSTDWGMNWASRPVPTSEDLNAGIGPTSGTSSIALVGGNNGVIYKTTDAGVNWISSNSGTTNNILGFGFGPTGINFAVGSNGTLLVSNDAGESWSSVVIPTSEDLYSISSSGQNSNWLIACGSNGTIIKSTNAGADWFLQSTPTTETLYSALAATNSIHFAVGYSGIVIKTTDGGGNPVIVEEDDKNPVDFELAQNYPNPFNPSTTISWQPPVSSQQTLKVYDMLGKEVAILVDEYKPAGSYEVDFDAKGLTSGIYFYRLSAGSFVETKKMILLK